jgi:hypothetical protein
MAFAISTANIPSIFSYTDALRYHDRAAQKPWRNGGEDFPFPEKRVRQYGVRKLNDGSIAFRLHSTDVVTWHPDNSLTLEVYTSQSTQAFANCLLPYGVSTGGGMTRLEIGRNWKAQKMYPIADTVHIAPDHETIDTPVVWERRRTDRKVARRVLAETRYAEYREWYKLMRSMMTEPPKLLGFWSPRETVAMLADQSFWHDLMTSWSGGTPDDVRYAIYDQTNEPVFYHERMPYVVGHNALKSCYAVSK